LTPSARGAAQPVHWLNAWGEPLFQLTPKLTHIDLKQEHAGNSPLGTGFEDRTVPERIGTKKMR